MIHRRQGAEQTCELQARLEKLCKRARKEGKAGKEWLKGELKKEVRTLKRLVANEGRDGLQRALRCQVGAAATVDASSRHGF